MRKALSLLSSFAVAAILFVTASVITAWTAPTVAPPDGNVPAPINVGMVDQIKSGGIGVNTLAVFGNAVISTVSGYLNFNTTVGVSGYGFRDNAGTMEFKNSSGQWRAIMGTLNGAAGPVSSIQFSDGTTQTTAATSSGSSGGGSTNGCPAQNISQPATNVPGSCTWSFPAAQHMRVLTVSTTFDGGWQYLTRQCVNGVWLSFETNPNSSCHGHEDVTWGGF